MLSMVEVKCPHCGVRGQILLPPLGALIVGPCPNCDEMVVVFCGRVLALDKEIMLKGTDLEKFEHLRGVLVEFIESRVAKVVEQLAPEIADGLRDYSPEAQADKSLSEDKASGEGAEQAPATDPNDPEISDSEVDAFIQFDLPRLDNKDYFRAIFD